MCKVYIKFVKLKRPKDRKTDIYEIITMDKDHLGYIKFDGAWRQYIYEPCIGTKWSSGCMDQVSAFLKEQNNKWRKKIAKKRKPV